MSTQLSIAVTAVSLWPTQVSLAVPVTMLEALLACLQVAAVAAGAPPPPVSARCQQQLDAWCASPAHCSLQKPRPGGSGDASCAVGQKMYALNDFGAVGHGPAQTWRCYAANNTNAARTRYVGGHCYCSRPDLREVLCKCDPQQCPPKPPPPQPRPPAAPLPLANSTSVVFDSAISPAGARAPVACYRIPAVCSTPNGTVIAFAEARLGKADASGKIVGPSCGDCVVNGIAQRRSTVSLLIITHFKSSNRSSPTEE